MSKNPYQCPASSDAISNEKNLLESRLQWIRFLPITVVFGSILGGCLGVAAGLEQHIHTLTLANLRFASLVGLTLGIFSASAAGCLMEIGKSWFFKLTVLSICVILGLAISAMATFFFVYVTSGA